MKLYVNGVDIFKQISVRYCVHEMNAENRADMLTLRFNDPKGVWNKWELTPGSKISFENGLAKTGNLFAHSTKSENGCYTVRAMSIPLISDQRKSKSWSGVHFLHLAHEIASKYHLEFKNYGCEDQLYKYIVQENETDLAFLWKICQLEGYQMIIYDENLIIYNEHYIENQPPATSLEIGSDGVFAYSDRSSEAFSSAVISSGNFFGSFKAPGVATSRILYPETAIKVTSNAEATRFAKGLLRANNKNLMSGSIVRELLPGYSAASVIRLKTLKATSWDGKIFLTKVRHDHVRNQTTIFFRKPLEGY